MVNDSADVTSSGRSCGTVTGKVRLPTVDNRHYNEGKAIGVDRPQRHCKTSDHTRVAAATHNEERPARTVCITSRYQVGHAVSISGRVSGSPASSNIHSFTTACCFRSPAPVNVVVITGIGGAGCQLHWRSTLSHYHTRARADHPRSNTWTTHDRPPSRLQFKITFFRKS